MAADSELKLTFPPVAGHFVQTIATGEHPLLPGPNVALLRQLQGLSVGNVGTGARVEEILALGPRGEGKTIGVLSGMILHALLHQHLGFDLPVLWLGARDTLENHKATTIRTLQKPLWNGMWRVYDGSKLAVAYHQPDPDRPAQECVQLRLVGINDQGEKDKLKLETTGLWFEEAAASAGLVVSSGLDEDSWDLGGTSCRVPSHFKPRVISENYPDEDHWSWQRFKPTNNPVFVSAKDLRELLDLAGIENNELVNEALRSFPNGVPWQNCIGVNPQAPERIFFRVPAGERASRDDRQAWARLLRERADLFVRLVLGLPGQVQLGDPVARTGLAGGYSPSVHVAPEEFKPWQHEQVLFGFDFGHTPTCIIGQAKAGGVRIFAGLHLKAAGMQQLLQFEVLPWLARYMPWLRESQHLIYYGYDPSGDTGEQDDIDRTAVVSIQNLLGGSGMVGPVKWPDRASALLGALGRRDGIVINPTPWTADLRRALESKWIYPKDHRGMLKSDQPKKPCHPWEDLGDGLIYLLCAAGYGNWGEGDQDFQGVVTSVKGGRR